MKIIPKRKLATTLIMLAIGLAVAGICLHGCAAPSPVTGNLHIEEARSQKLTALAAEEADQIGEVDMRLTRQLNLADTQSTRGWEADARTTLAAARKTLNAPEAAKLNTHARMSGWVSVSELSRRVKDAAGALSATEAALRDLDGVEDPGKRCQYVMGLANELQYIKGKPAAAALLARAGPWTKSIDNLPLRRQALVAFSAALFTLDDFTAGQSMLRQETDAAWRSDILASMAPMPRPAEKAYRASDAPMAPGSLSSSAATQPFFGRNLHYEQVFQNQKSSQTSKD